jgi:GMP synthase (glutamine-hydrolysing)
MGLRMLLLQARLADDPIRAHEHSCFVAATGLAPEDVVPHDLMVGPPSVTHLKTFDMLSVGGSGEFYVSKANLPMFEAYLGFLREVVARGHPTFASCYGYQSIARALGAEVIHDPANAEVGTFELTLTEAGRADPLFGTLPERFAVQLGHKERATADAPGTINLAGSPRSPYQALRIPDKPIWASQFHPEMNRDQNLERFRRYLRDYGPPDPQDLEAAFARFSDSTDASSLLRRFVSLVFG